MTAIIWTVVAAILQIVLLTMQQWISNNAAQKKKVSDEDARIDSFVSADDIMRD